MAENQGSQSDQEKTEEPSQHRLEKARKDGDIAQSKEITSLFVLFGVLGSFYFGGEHIVDNLFNLIRFFFEKSATYSLTTNNVAFIFSKALSGTASVVLPIAVAGFFAGIVGSIIQIGFNLSWKPIEPSLNKINPLNGVKKLFSANSLVEGGKSIFKLVAVIIVTYIICEKNIIEAPNVSDFEVSQIISYMANTSFQLMGGVGIALLVIALVDFGWQKFRHRKQLMMTKQEVKQEQKEKEGDPLIKSRIRSIQREIARKRMMREVETADVVVTNPTHISVAIRYSSEKMAAPIVVAKGADNIALKIREIAKKHNVPIVENVPLARALHKTVKIGFVIPRTLYQAVAEVLAYVYRLKGKI